MRKQILSGFMMFALVAGSLAPAGEARAEEFQVVDSDNDPIYNEAKDQFETKVELTGANAGKFRFQKDGGNWLETTENSAVFGVEPIGISLYRCAYTETDSSEEKEWRLINISYIDNGELTLNKNLSLEYFFGKLPQKENLWLDVSLAKGDEKYLTYSKLGNFLRLKKRFLGEKNFSVKLMETKEGETKELDLTFPDDYYEESVAGKPVVFKVTLQKFARPSELNDEWVAANTEYKTVDEYRAAVKKELEENETKSADYDLYSNAWSEVLANSEVKEYPEEDVDKAVESYKKLNENYVKEAGMEMSDFLKAQGMSEEDYEEDCQQYAESKVEQNLIVQGIMDAEGLSLDDDDIQTLKDELLSEYGYESFDQLVAYYGEQEVNESLALMRVERFIVDNATVNETSATEADVANEDADPESEDTGVDAAEDTIEDNASEEDSSDTAEESEETASEDDVANEG